MDAKSFWSWLNNSRSDFFFTLYERWTMEKDYEDIEEYAKVFQREVCDIPCVKVVGSTKKPFGFKVQCSDGVVHVIIKRDGAFEKIYCKRVS